MWVFDARSLIQFSLGCRIEDVNRTFSAWLNGVIEIKRDRSRRRGMGIEEKLGEQRLNRCPVMTDPTIAILRPGAGLLEPIESALAC